MIKKLKPSKVIHPIEPCIIFSKWNMMKRTTQT